MKRPLILYEKNHVSNRIILFAKIKYIDAIYETAFPFIEKMCAENNYNVAFEKFRFELTVDLCKNEIIKVKK